MRLDPAGAVASPRKEAPYENSVSSGGETHARRHGAHGVQIAGRAGHRGGKTGLGEPAEHAGAVAAKGTLPLGAFSAKGILADATAKAPYVAKAKEVHKPVFALIMGDFLTPSVVDEIDLGGYHKHAGEPILIKAHDDFEVTGVTVSIVDNTQAAVEQGTATFDASVNAWRYVATADASAKPNVTVTAKALDRPGHAGTLSAMA